MSRINNLLLLTAPANSLYVPAFYRYRNLVVVSGRGCLPLYIRTGPIWFLSDLPVPIFNRLPMSGMRNHASLAPDSSRPNSHGLHAQSAFSDLDPVYLVRVSSLQHYRAARWSAAPKRLAGSIYLRIILYRGIVLDLS